MANWPDLLLYSFLNFLVLGIIQTSVSWIKQKRAREITISYTSVLSFPVSL